MNNPNDILGMAAHLNGDTFLKRLNDEQMEYLRRYMAERIEKLFGKKASDQAIDLGLEMYAQGIDDAGGAWLLMWRLYQAQQKQAKQTAKTN